MSSEKFWLEDYSVLYKNNNYIKFVPFKSMTKIQQLNAITRFSIYAFLLILIFENESVYLLIPIFLIILTIVLYKTMLKKNAESFDPIVKVNPPCPDNSCTAPTIDNPFMNFMLSDYTLNPDKPPACTTTLTNPSDKQIIKEEIDLSFNENLYRDVDDLFDKKNSQRQFYTTPSTTNPNDQKAFAEWLYRVPETCKTDQVKCLKYEDLRYTR